MTIVSVRQGTEGAVNVKPRPASGAGVQRSGPRGKGWVFGVGAPLDIVGVDGDMYYDTASHKAYGPKIAGSWSGAPVVDFKADADAAIAAQAAAEQAAAEAAEDAEETAADRTQTGLDRSAASASATNAANSASAASSSASAAAGSATSADASADAADVSEAGAAASAATATTKAVEAATSASNAAGSASAAAGSATVADASADSAAANASQTAADRVQTGVDREAAEDAAAAAATFDPSNFYTKGQVDGLIDDYAADWDSLDGKPTKLEGYATAIFSSAFAAYQSGTTAGDSLKVVSNNLGAGFAVQNLASGGFSGIEYIGSDGAVKVFSGYANMNPGEFRFNNIAPGAHILFKLNSVDRLKLRSDGIVEMPGGAMVGTLTGVLRADGGVLSVQAIGTAATKDAGLAAGNVPLLGAGGLLDPSVIPAIAISDTFEVGSQAAMLALDAQRGDIAIRTDENKTYVLSSNSPGTLADWKWMRTPTDLVLSVAGLTGTITAAALKTALAMTLADITDASANGRSLVAAADYSAMRSLLSLVVGTNVQAYNAKLAALAAQTWAADRFTYQTSASAVAVATLTSFARTLLDDADQATAQATLGVTPGTNVQAFSSLLSSLAALTLTGNAGKSIAVNSGATGFELVAGGGTVIRSIQRGSSFSSTANTVINIASVDPTKSFIVLDSAPSSGTGGGGGYITAFTATSFTIAKNSSNVSTIVFSWTVVEYL